MHIKKFKGRTLEEVLREVKEAFGEDAIILSTKKNHGYLEVVAAIDFDLEGIERGLSKGIIKQEFNGLRMELQELKSLFSSLIKESTIRELASIGNGALSLYQELLSCGIDDRLSQTMIRQAAASASEEAELKEHCYRLIRENTSITNPLAGRDKPKILALVGPTGVGKTTTIAKLAGRLRQEYGARVGLISIDTRRVGAVEALKACVSDFGITVDTPRSKEAFNKIIWSYKDKDVVLIDTPGKNPKDVEAIAELKDILGNGLPITTGLVLSMTSRDDTLLDACQGFSTLSIDWLVFTKIDEANRFGPLLNTSARIKKPIAYLCNGQRIPQDIGLASHELVGSLVLRRG